MTENIVPLTNAPGDAAVINLSERDKFQLGESVESLTRVVKRLYTEGKLSKRQVIFTAGLMKSLMEEPFVTSDPIIAEAAGVTLVEGDAMKFDYTIKLD